MARPIKQGLDYYSIDTNVFMDRKIRTLIRKYNAKGWLVYSYILTEIYRDKGFYIDYDNNLVDDISDYLRLEVELITEIIQFCCEITLFNSVLFLEEKILTSESIQKRWVKISQYIPNFFITSNVNLIKEIKIPKYKLLDEKPRLYQYNVKLWYRIIKEVFKRDNYTCQYCGQIGGKLEADHIIPFSKGGSDEMSNLITSCRKCNRQKKDKAVDEFIKWRELN